MGWTYNTLEGTASEGPRITAIALTVTILALIALLLRLYVRTLIVKAVGAGMSATMTIPHLYFSHQIPLPQVDLTKG